LATEASQFVLYALAICPDPCVVGTNISIVFVDGVLAFSVVASNSLIVLVYRLPLLLLGPPYLVADLRS
jgi:hypothetical protein